MIWMNVCRKTHGILNWLNIPIYKKIIFLLLIQAAFFQKRRGNFKRKKEVYSKELIKKVQGILESFQKLINENEINQKSTYQALKFKQQIHKLRLNPKFINKRCSIFNIRKIYRN